MRTQTQDKEIPLTEGCFRMKCSYMVGRDRVLRGELQGRQDERGKWLVSEASVRAYEERMARAQRSNRTAA